MYQKDKLRGMDIITSILFFLLGIWILVESFKMPLRDSFGGVESVWYVSPALLPLIIGSAIVLLSIVIFLHALKESGLQSLKDIIQEAKKTDFFSDSNIRFAAVLVPLLSLVYINISRVDFVLSVISFLLFTICVFYFDDMLLMKKLLFVYTIQMGVLGILALFNLDEVLYNIFYYTVDILMLVFILFFLVYMLKTIKNLNLQEYKEKQRRVILVSFITPIVVVIIFKYLLRIPMPYEGGIVDLMSMIYYSIR